MAIQQFRMASRDRSRNEEQICGVLVNLGKTAAPAVAVAAYKNPTTPALHFFDNLRFAFNLSLHSKYSTKWSH